MKLEAKSRLTATALVTAAKGDAAPFRAAVNAVIREVQLAIKSLPDSPKVAKSSMRDACRVVTQGIRDTFKGKAKVSSLETTLDDSEGTLMGGVAARLQAPNGKEFELSWEFNLFEDKPGEFSFWVGGDTPKYAEYKSTVKKGFDKTRYTTQMKKAIDAFEKDGFVK